MTAVKVFEFSPDEALDLGASVDGGVQKVLDDYTNGKAVEGITSYVMAGNLYVVVTTT